MKQICYQIVTDQQTGQKIQIVTALDQTATSKQFILTNHDGSAPSKVILARQDPTPGKVFLTTPDAAGGQLFFTSPDISAQHIQVWCPIFDGLFIQLLKIKAFSVVMLGSFMLSKYSNFISEEYASAEFFDIN